MGKGGNFRVCNRDPDEMLAASVCNSAINE